MPRSRPFGALHLALRGRAKMLAARNLLAFSIYIVSEFTNSTYQTITDTMLSVMVVLCNV